MLDTNWTVLARRPSRSGPWPNPEVESIVNMTSILGFACGPGAEPLTRSKAGVVALTKGDGPLSCARQDPSTR